VEACCAEKLGFAILVISLAVEIVFDARLAQESANTELKAAELQKAVVWRSLTGEQQREIAQTLKSYAKEKVGFSINFSGLEAWAFADQIEVSLRYKNPAPWSARWDVHLGISDVPHVASGVILETTPLANERDLAAARVLDQALEKIAHSPVLGPSPPGMEMKGETGFGDLDSNAHIMVTVCVHPASSPELDR
jgi:hypothetical protein